MEPLINELINEPDMIEIVRDQVGAILSLELRNQHALAKEAALPDVNDFDIPVYVENGRPYEAQGDEPVMRFINILLQKAKAPQTNPRAGSQKETASFYIDCVACGNDLGNFRDDKSAAIKAWKVCRLARRILMSDMYMYLGLRGIVGQRIVVSMESGSPEYQKDSESALAYVIIRITLEVTFAERSIGTRGEILERIDFEVSPDTGELVAGSGNQQ